MNVDQWRRATALTNAGRHAPLFNGLPQDVGGLAEVVQGVLLHQHIAPAYGVTLTPAQLEEPHLRGVESMLERIVSHNSRPLFATRPVDERLVGVCRHFTLMHVAMLRTQGVPARARCGFATYFEKGKFLDHWVTEYWNEDHERWVLADAQLDARQRKFLGIDFDPLDVPRDKFLIAGDAWALCRQGRADPGAFGILDMFGLWFIASNVIRDVAALNNHEMLPWDVWGAMTLNEAELDLGFIDRMAALTHEPDRHVDELRRAYEDERIVVPPTVLNAVLNRHEQL